jgi:hypothetical protein
MSFHAETARFIIADFSIKLFTKSPNKFLFEEGYLPFLSNLKDDDYSIEVISNIPSALSSRENLVFSSDGTQNSCWFVCSEPESEKIRIVVADPNKPENIQQVAILSIHSKNWTIYCNPNNEGYLFPLAYPLGPILLYYLVVENNSLMMHASCISDQGKGRIFSGFSGIGKSTMASIWAKEGYQVINDDRLIIRFRNGKARIYNTPMFYSDEPKSVELHALYLLKQAKENTIKQLNYAEAVSRIMAFCIQHSYKKEFLENHLQTILSLYEQIPIYELGFKPDAEIIDFIRSHE